MTCIYVKLYSVEKLLGMVAYRSHQQWPKLQNYKWLYGLVLESLVNNTNSIKALQNLLYYPNGRFNRFVNGSMFQIIMETHFYYIMPTFDQKIQCGIPNAEDWLCKTHYCLPYFLRQSCCHFNTRWKRGIVVLDWSAKHNWNRHFKQHNGPCSPTGLFFRYHIEVHELFASIATTRMLIGIWYRAKWLIYI